MRIVALLLCLLLNSLYSSNLFAYGDAAKSLPQIFAIGNNGTVASRPGYSYVDIFGDNFQDSDSVLVRWRNGSRLLNDRVTFISRYQLRIRVRTGTEESSWQVYIVTADGYKSAAALLQIVNDASGSATIFQTIPKTLPADGKSHSLLIIGNNFLPQQLVQVDWGSGKRLLPSNRVEVVDRTNIVITVTTGTNANVWTISLIAAPMQSIVSSIKVPIELPQ